MSNNRGRAVPRTAAAVIGFAAIVVGAFGLVSLPQSSSAAGIEGYTTAWQSPATVPPMLSVPQPAGVSAGDVLLLQVTWQGGDSLTPAVSSPWQQLVIDHVGEDIGQAVYAADADDVASAAAVAFIDGNQVATAAAGAMVAVSGVDLGDLTLSTNSGDGNPGPRGDALTIGPGEFLLIGFYGIADRLDMSAPGGGGGAGTADLIYQYQHGDDEDVSLMAMSQELDQQSSSSTGRYPTSVSGQPEPWVVHLLAFELGTIEPEDQAITFEQPSSPQAYGGTLTVSPTADSGLDVELEVDSGSTEVCQIDGPDDGVWTVTMLAATGSCSLTASQPGDDNYNAADPVTRVVAASPATMTGSFTVDDKDYDGGTSATINTRTPAGVIGGDDVQITGGTAAFDDANVGVGIGVTGSGFTLSGSDAGNYTLGAMSGSPGSINPVALDVDADSASKTAGEPDPTFTWTLDGFVNGEDSNSAGVTGDASCARTNDSIEAVGSYPGVIVCSPGSLQAGNYTFQAGESGDFTINPVTLSVHAVSGSKTYGESDPSFGYTLSGFLAGDDADNINLSGEADCSRTGGDEDAGTYEDVISCEPGTLSADGYTFEAGDDADFTINPLAVDGQFTVEDKTYDGTTDGTLDTHGLSGVLVDDDVELVPGSVAFDSADAGTDIPVSASGFALGGNDAHNYTINVLSGSPADIHPKVLDVVAPSPVIGEGDNPPSLTPGISGFVPGEDTSELGTIPSCDTDYQAGDPAGNYPVTCSGGVADNYAFDYEDGALTVTQDTGSPTASPTPDTPTATPTVETPTATPTVATPTATPTTETPTATATAEPPTSTPTVEPTATATATVEPPTSTPTSEPTATPTDDGAVAGDQSTPTSTATPGAPDTGVGATSGGPGSTAMGVMLPLLMLVVGVAMACGAVVHVAAGRRS